jgi:hypothetical protein
MCRIRTHSAGSEVLLKLATNDPANWAFGVARNGRNAYYYVTSRLLIRNIITGLLPNQLAVCR